MSFSKSFIAGVYQKINNKTTRFLTEMNDIIPWETMVRPLDKIKLQNKTVWRPAYSNELLLKIIFLQQWFNLSDEAVEEAIHDRISFQKFLDIDIMWDSIPDSTTLCLFRKKMNENNIQEEIFERINKHLISKWILIKEGTLVDATILQASSSTKNKKKERDPEMHSTKKWNNYYFWAKAHIWVDEESWCVHSMEFTAANEHDWNMTDQLLHWKEKRLYWDSAYYSKEKKEKFENKKIAFNVVKRWNLTDFDRFINRFYSRTRSKVEHVFHIVKFIRGHKNVKYKWLHKNKCQRYLLLGLSNLYRVRAKLALM